MHKPSMYAALALLISAGNVFAFTVKLTVGGSSNVLIPIGGTTLDVRIDILRDSSTNNIGAAQMDFVADVAGLTINGSSGGTGISGTGTRYNGPAEWDSSTTGNALNPNTTLAGPMSPGVPRGVMGTLYAANGGNWLTGDSFFGILNVTIQSGVTGPIVLSPTNIFLAENETFDD